LQHRVSCKFGHRMAQHDMVLIICECFSQQAVPHVCDIPRSYTSISGLQAQDQCLHAACTLKTRLFSQIHCKIGEKGRQKYVIPTATAKDHGGAKFFANQYVMSLLQRTLNTQIRSCTQPRDLVKLGIHHPSPTPAPHVLQNGWGGISMIWRDRVNRELDPGR